MNRERALITLRTLERFIVYSFGLGLGPNPNMLSASLINANLLSTCAYNTYIETLSNKSDTILKYCKLALTN